MSNPEVNNQGQQGQPQTGAPVQRRSPFEGAGKKFADMNLQKLLIILGVITAIVIFFQIYFSLMSFSIFNIGLRIAIIVLALIWSVPLLMYYLRYRQTETKKMKAFNKVHWGWKIPAGIAVVVTVISICLAIFTTPMFMAKSYNSMINVDTKSGTAEEPYKEFSAEMDDFTSGDMKVAIVDEPFAAMLGEKVLGEGSGYASQYVVRDYTLIHYKDSLYWVGALEPKGFFQWTSSASTGTPGYVMVDATQTGDEAKAELVTSHKLKFTPGAYLWHDAERQMYFSDMTALRESRLNFEIDDNGIPYYTQVIYEKKFGITNGDNATGLIIMNATTGECKSYDMDKVPEWVDNVQSPNMTIKQIDYWGEYSHGYFNTWFAKKEVNNTTKGYTYVYNNDRLYITTGMTAKSNDSAIVGMVLSDTRTKQTTMYNMVGATEQAAMRSAEGIQEVAAAKYSATFPTLINFDGVPTFYMALKDNAGNIKMYAFVSVEEYTSKLAAGRTPQEAQEKYSKVIGSDNKPDKPVPPEGEEKTGQINYIREYVQNGNTMFLLDIDGVEYKVSINVTGAEKLLRANVNNTIKYLVSNGQITKIISIA